MTDRRAIGPHPEEILIDAGALTVGGLDYGDPPGVDDATPVLMTHGQADSAWSLDPLARHLGDRYRIVDGFLAEIDR